MQRMQYTTQQENKLIEMVLFLFPEYKKVKISGAFLYLDKGQIPFDTIPIFEFCMTHLANKIYYPDLDNISRTARDKIQSFFFSSFMEAIEGGPAGYEHPIDYLYSEFLKLK